MDNVSKYLGIYIDLSNMYFDMKTLSSNSFLPVIKKYHDAL